VGIVADARAACGALLGALPAAPRPDSPGSGWGTLWDEARAARHPKPEWLIETVRDLKSGRLDHELVYRKRLRQRLAEYPTDGAPPHVRAARIRREGDPEDAEVEYFMTLRGPEPAAERRSPIDHAHYLEKQLAPVCDVILPFVGTTFEETAGMQGRLF